MVYKCFDKRLLGEYQLKNYTNQLLKKFKNRKVQSLFIDNICSDMQLISKFNKKNRFLLLVTDIFSKYGWVIPLKDKKGIIITKTFQNFLDESNGKPNKIWVDNGCEFYNRSMKSWLEKTPREMYSRHNKGKSVSPEVFIRTLKNRIYKYMTSILKNVYIDEHR